MNCRDCSAELPMRKGRGRQPVFCTECRNSRRRASDSASKRAKYASDTLYAERERRRAGRRIGHLFFHATQ